METAGFLRRIFALIYDSLAVLGIIFSLSLVLVWSNSGSGEPGSLISYIQILIILISGPLFYSYFWIKNNGQTLGMQAWKIKLVSTKESPLTLNQALTRCLVSALSVLCLGFGYLWILFNKERLSWADMVTHTKIVKLKID